MRPFGNRYLHIVQSSGIKRLIWHLRKKGIGVRCKGSYENFHVPVFDPAIGRARLRIIGVLNQTQSRGASSS